MNTEQLLEQEFVTWGIRLEDAAIAFTLDPLRDPAKLRVTAIKFSHAQDAFVSLHTQRMEKLDKP